MVLNKQAIELLEENQVERAFSIFKRLAMTSPNVQTMNNLAWFYLNIEEDYEMAKTYLNEVIKLKPHSPFPFAMLGEIYLREEQFELAEQFLKRSIKIEETTSAFYNLAITYLNMQNLSEAAGCLKKIQDEDNDYKIVLATVRILLGQKEAAKRTLDALEIQEEDFRIAASMADLYVELEQYERAIELYLMDCEPMDLTVYELYNVAYCYMQIGKLEKANALIEQKKSLIHREYMEAKNAKLSDDYSKEEMEEHLDYIAYQMNILELAALQSKPTLHKDFSPASGCQLFGCDNHGHSNYEQ